jgi:2-polyprenyl-3-methyl-5-hydroxy-6-metoxy-1,4-benzoquinol methylase
MHCCGGDVGLEGETVVGSLKETRIHSSEPVRKPFYRRIAKLLGKSSLAVQARHLWMIARELFTRDQRLFDSMQTAYFHWAPPEQQRYESILEEVTSQLGTPPWGDVLEVGCSLGSFTQDLARLCKSITSCDISEIACERTRQRCSTLTNVRVNRLDILREAIPGEYDLVFVMDVLEYVHGRTPLRRAIENVTQPIRPGGLLVFCDIRSPEPVRCAWWQRWLPEGADRIIVEFAQRPDLRLIRTRFHGNSDPPFSGWIDHLSAIFEKL